MNYGQLRDAALGLINQYSIAGTDIALSYNNQSDYVRRIPPLVNAGLAELVTAERYLPAQKIYNPKTEGEEFGRYKKYMLPGDFFAPQSQGLVVINGNQHDVRTQSRFNNYVLMEPDYILIGKELSEPVLFEYYREPHLVNTHSPSDKDPIDGPLEIQNALVWYVAAHLVLYDDAFQYASLYNEYENKVARLKQRPAKVDIAPTEDVYGFADVYMSVM